MFAYNDDMEKLDTKIYIFLATKIILTDYA
jgi:hypothetical protein